MYENSLLHNPKLGAGVSDKVVIKETGRKLRVQGMCGEVEWHVKSKEVGGTQVPNATKVDVSICNWARVGQPFLPGQGFTSAQYRCIPKRSTAA